MIVGTNLRGTVLEKDVDHAATYTAESDSWVTSPSPKNPLAFLFPAKSTRKFEQAVFGELDCLYRVARRLTRRTEEAEDLVATTLMRAYSARGNFDGRHLRAWLIRILRNEYLNLRRSETRRMEVDMDDEFDAPDESSWEDIANKIEAGLVIEALAEIPESYRMAIQLCDIEEMTYEEAAVALDIPSGTVRSRLFRARNMLRRKLCGRVDRVN